jgi:Domain of unknown function (DUF4114)
MVTIDSNPNENPSEISTAIAVKPIVVETSASEPETVTEKPAPVEEESTAQETSPEDIKLFKGDTVEEEKTSTPPVIDPTIVSDSGTVLPDDREIVKDFTPQMVQRGTENDEPQPVESAGGGVSDPETMADGDPRIYQSGAGGSSSLGVTVHNNLFKTDLDVRGFGITAISKKPSRKVSEIALFAVDDLSGKIGNLKPNDPGYLRAATYRAQTVFSTIHGNFFNSGKRAISISPAIVGSTPRTAGPGMAVAADMIPIYADPIYQVIEIEDSSLAEVIQQLEDGKTPSNILYSVPDENGYSPIQITRESDSDDYQISIDNDRLVLKVEKLSDPSIDTPIGAKSQSSPAGRVFDLTYDWGKNFQGNLATRGDSLYNNQVGFYEVTYSDGSLLVNGTIVKPGDANYAQEAIKRAVANAEFLAGKGENKGLTIAGGKIYAPVVVSQGTLEEFLSRNPSNSGGENDIHAYFNYVGANPDRVDHFRLLGDNTFAFEDKFGGGDRDYNDLIIKMDFTV